MQSATDDVNETRVVLTCCKNNDGKLGERTAWARKNGLFAPVSDFDWEEWDSAGKAAKRSFAMASEIVAKSGVAISKKNLASEIIKKGVSQRTAYRWISQAEEKRLIKFCKEEDGYLPC